MVVNFFARYGLTNGIPYHVTIGEFVLSLVSVTLAGMATYLFTAGQKSEKKPTHLKQAA
jgi:hypothetical protein